ncbi:hypothetical protein [Kitasatospora sp. Ki12]
MLPVHLTLMPTGANRPTEDVLQALEDTLWAHATPESAMEHLRVRAIPEGIGLVLFIRAATPDIARAGAERLVIDALAAAGSSVDGYTVMVQC